MIDVRPGRIFGGLVLGALLALPLAAHAARTVDKATLVATDAAPDGAAGQVTLVLSEARSRMMLRVSGLEPKHEYDVLVDGELVATFATNGRGRGHALFLTAQGKRKHALRRVFDLDFDPSDATIVVRDAATQADVLTGAFGDGGSPGGAFACCKPHVTDDVLECELETPEECAADGGASSDATSCEPSPCGDPAEIVCCDPQASVTGAFLVVHDDGDGDGVCEDGPTADECAGRGGTVVSAPSCDPNPCMRDDERGDDDDRGEDDDGPGRSGRGHGRGGKR